MWIFILFLSLTQSWAGLSVKDVADPCKEKEEESIEALSKKNSKANRKIIDKFVEADKCCRNPEQKGCYSDEELAADDQQKRPESGGGIKDPGLIGAKAMTDEARRAKKRSRFCGNKNYQSAVDGMKENETSKDESERQESLEFMKSAVELLKKREACHNKRNEEALAKAEDYVNSANAASAKSQLEMNCRKFGDGSREDCHIRDNTQDSELVSGNDRDKLAVKALPNEKRCTMVADPQGNALTATHCDTEMNDTTSALAGPPNANGDRNPETTHFKHAASTTMDKGDMTLYKPKDGPVADDSFFKGKPYYLLTRDQTLSSGCITRGSELACSPVALREIAGRPAEIQGYPGTYFTNDKRADVPDRDTSVLVSRGPVYYSDRPLASFQSNGQTVNPRSGIIDVVTYVRPGNSGGPAYFQAGQNFGGVTVDRPVVAGVVSTRYTTSEGTTYAQIPIIDSDQAKYLLVPQSITNQQLVQSMPLFSGK